MKQVRLQVFRKRLYPEFIAFGVHLLDIFLVHWVNPAAPIFHILNGVIVVVVFFGESFGISSPGCKAVAKGS